MIAKFFKAALVSIVLGLSALGATTTAHAANDGKWEGYVGKVNGNHAVATIWFETQQTRTKMKGEIVSGDLRYKFRVNLVSSTGYGTMVAKSENGRRFEIRVQLTANGFVLVANPFKSPETYYFAKG